MYTRVVFESTQTLKTKKSEHTYYLFSGIREPIYLAESGIYHVLILQEWFKPCSCSDAWFKRSGRAAHAYKADSIINDRSEGACRLPVTENDQQDGCDERVGCDCDFLLSDFGNDHLKKEA
jgi:hypothetical protein